MKKFEKKSAGTLERLRIRSGIYASAVTVLVVVLAVLLNLIVRAVPTKYTEFDLSEAGLYTLSGSSKDIAHALTQDVTIYYLARDGQRGRIITKLLDRYASESSHINVGDGNTPLFTRPSPPSTACSRLRTAVSSSSRGRRAPCWRRLTSTIMTTPTTTPPAATA